MSGPAVATRCGERGSVLLVVVILIAALTAMTATLIGRASLTAAELRARRDVLCARYAAFGGLTLGVPMSGSTAAAMVGPRAASLTVSRVRMSAKWCVLRATATCGVATRTLDRTLGDPLLCNSASP